MPFYVQTTEGGVVFAQCSTHEPIQGPGIVEVPDLSENRLGKRYDAEASAAAGLLVFVDVPAPPAVAPEWAWLIDIGPFFDRFGGAKMAVLTSGDAGVKAILADLQVRKWIDLQRPDVATGLQYVGTKVPAVTAQLQADILGTQPAPAENLALRKLYF